MFRACVCLSEPASVTVLLPARAKKKMWCCTSLPLPSVIILSRRRMSYVIVSLYPGLAGSHTTKKIQNKHAKRRRFAENLVLFKI